MQISPNESPARTVSENRKFILIWFALVAVFVLPHFRFLFLESFTELGDSAVNALEITKAKSFSGLYGNYSRWGFHHPGPAFFYGYAAGEFLLRDVLHAVRSPNSAHIIAGIFIQSGFFVWSLAIIRRHVRHPLIVPVILLAGALHFGAVNYHIPASSFESIWPPHVLLFPFLCFVIACAAIGSGSLAEILPAVVSGSMLVHGHVAQPLFVIPFFILACVAFATGSLVRRQSITTELRKHRIQLLISAALLMVFLLPIVMDALKGEKSNLHHIRQHLAVHSDDHKTVSQSLVYLCTFFCYLAEPEKIFSSNGTANFAFLWERWPFTAIWAAIAVAALVWMPIAFRQTNRFVRWLYIYLGFGLALTICWGVLQNGPMFNFNSYFNFGLIFVAVILVVIGTCSYLAGPFNRRTGIALGSAAILLYLTTAYSWRCHIAFRDLNQVTEFTGLKEFAQKDGKTVKFLKFNHPDWPWVAGVALALERLGYGFAVAPRWEFMFGAEHRLNPPDVIREHGMAVWNFGPETENIGSFRLATGLSISRSALQPINPRNGEITFAGPNANAAPYVVDGWDVSNGPFSWSTSKIGLFYFQPERANSDVNVAIELFPAKFSKKKSQRVGISFNNTLRENHHVAGRKTLNIRIPQTVWNQRPEALLLFEFPDAISPLAAGVSSDPRVISCGFTRITFQETPGLQP